MLRVSEVRTRLNARQGLLLINQAGRDPSYQSESQQSCFGGWQRSQDISSTWPTPQLEVSGGIQYRPVVQTQTDKTEPRESIHVSQ